jgi:hypothetical protein
MGRKQHRREVFGAVLAAYCHRQFPVARSGIDPPGAVAMDKTFRNSKIADVGGY